MPQNGGISKRMQGCRELLPRNTGGASECEAVQYEIKSSRPRAQYSRNTPARNRRTGVNIDLAPHSTFESMISILSMRNPQSPGVLQTQKNTLFIASWKPPNCLDSIKIPTRRQQITCAIAPHAMMRWSAFARRHLSISIVRMAAIAPAAHYRVRLHMELPFGKPIKRTFGEGWS